MDDKSDDKPSLNVVSMPTKKDAHPLGDAAINAIIAYTPNMARLRKAAFDEYVKVGFTEEQALKLCTM